jgi:DNA polymerase/3'-5' exonuclease PolX
MIIKYIHLRLHSVESKPILLNTASGNTLKKLKNTYSQKILFHDNSKRLSFFLEMSDFKQIIIDSLDILRKRDIANKEPFKARSYSKVISQLKNDDKPIISYDDISKFEGIGDNISRKIREIIDTGHLASAEKAKELYNIDALDSLQKIYGVGPVKATELVKSGITSISQLRTELHINPGLLNEKQTIGLKYYEDLLERIPHEEILEHLDILDIRKPYEMEEYELQIVGSFRREAITSGDIDVLIRIPEGVSSDCSSKLFKLYIKLLKDFGYIQEILALGDHKCMAISRIYNGKARRIDLLMTPYYQYPYALLYFTGSDLFNVAFRQYTLQKGYTLNEYKLTRIRDNVPEVPFIDSERGIFEFLKLRYIQPSKRINNKQIIPLSIRPKIAVYDT